MRSPTSLHESRVYSPENFWSPMEKDFCNNICQKRTYERRQPGRAAGIRPGRTDVRARSVATGVTPAARLCADRLRIWRDLPDDGKVKNPSDWKCGIQDRIDESARQSSALYRSGRRAH